MKESKENKIDEIVFFTKKLPFYKQEEALDYVKWLWLNIGKETGRNIKTVIKNIREIQLRHKAGKDWDSVDTIRKWRDSR
ncbi:hypothetical protein COT42_07430 [Candidatus Saganbacteria bacterium CG08_land_8_20_14_0_20_45_16]|uniref:Uncharacterized protein n=1 Tax=Candidatus Saganbacteria bacterium CG08_land_8_20_14_0_20_45_16 TaxID=2014293 RepID=A0A2H0XUL7_UNCSA|nr:MAG: hypothetical protein COT42_07430 [Candidatus Saganbacteria bacterium CG08_land_8_20_14_0_20_45_16]